MKAVERLLRKAVGDQQSNRRPSGPTLGDDILDLAPFGNRWERALEAALGSRKVADDVAALLTGRSQALRVGTSRQAVAEAFGTEPRLMGAIGAVLSPQQRQEFARISYVDWTIERFVSVSLQSRPGGSGRDPIHGRLSVTDLKRIGPALGWPSDALIDLILSVSNQAWRYGNLARNLTGLAGFEEFVIAEADRIRAAVAPPARKDHDQIWQRLASLSSETVQMFLPELANAAAAQSKGLREQAARMLGELPVDAVIAELRTVALNGSATETANAIDALSRFAPQDALPELVDWARTNFESSRSTSVAEAVERLATTVGRAPTELPPLPPVDVAGAPRIGRLPQLPAGWVKSDELAQVANGESDAPSIGGVWQLTALLRSHPKAVSDFTDVHVARVLLNGGLRYQSSPMVRQILTVADPAPSTLLAVANHDGFDPRSTIGVVGAVVSSDPGHWTDQELSVWAAHCADPIVDFLGNRDFPANRDGVLAALGRTTNRPAHLDDALAAAAVNGYKADRERLYTIIDESFIDRILPFLTKRAKSDRKGAAEWIRSHPSEVAIKPLLTQARKEKDDGVKASLLSALEVLDVDIAEFVSPEALAADAAKAMRRKNAVPKSIEWLDFGHLPPLAWHDGTPVDADIVKMFVVNAVKAKTAEPSPILRRHFDNMNQEQVRVFGRTLLDLWIAEDLRTYSGEEALAEAQRQAPLHFSWSQRGHGRFPGQSQQQIEDALHDELLRTVKGSATTSKGLLAVVAATAGGDVAEKVLAYIRRHRGQRANQAKILLQMLAWIDEPAAIQAVMAVAARFRPKGIQDEANNQARLLAERHGWTLDDLADRSVPDGGFDAEGRSVYDYGSRTFTAHLGDDLVATLTNDETGKTVRSLPKGRADEDADLIKGLKQELSAAKKDLKSTAKIQPDRLHQAMCTQREWAADHFTRYLVDHPVMVRLASRLVWRRRPAGDGSLATAFRPLTDGTLLDADDEDVVLNPDDRITLAHEQLLSADEVEAWRRHLADYEISPLFPQFGRPAFEPAEDQTEIDDVYGHVLTDNSMRSAMNRQAWQLGQPQDAGIAWEVVKHFPSAELVAVLSLQENGLSAARYDGDLEVVLGALFFVPGDSPHSATAAVDLADVPPVLLSETYGEVKAIAAAGSGFNPAYARKGKRR